MRAVVLLLSLGSCRPAAVVPPTSSSRLEFDALPDRSDYPFSAGLFDSGAPDSMTFTVTFRNGLKDPVTVCTSPTPTLTTANVLFQNEKLKPEIYEVHFEVWPACAPEDLVTLRPGQSTYYKRRGLDGYRLAEGESPKVFKWYPVGWHEYRVDFRYRYDGPDYGKPNVFRGTLEANNVRFNIE